MQQRARTRAAQALAYVYFVRKGVKQVTGVARVDDPKTVAEYRNDPMWKQVTREEYLSARASIAFC